ncbi:MFS monosaccharide transporter [Neolentinus lepideus HHB14362 ss-1]|uniref:MFS monosaccharide transporter n=1 Tax=Neolentinus lepideus HHB14362 ss-1 TaxID=1314782 RepID=A0A165QJB5_9AGAM|nr:MFS monosaccharide transporter [Neolentinus lepideus HHB14362 ss-1]
MVNQPSLSSSDLDSQPLLRSSSTPRNLKSSNRSVRASTTTTVLVSSTANITISSPLPGNDIPESSTHDHPELTYTYAYGPTGLLGLRRNRYALGCALFASIGGWVFGYDQGVVANVLVMKAFLQRFPLDAWGKGMLTASLDLGALFGALMSGLADRYSRKTAIFWACVVFIVGTILQALALSVFLLVLGRGLSGIGIGALSTLSPLYITEISPPELRGSLLALEQFSIVLGCVAGFWVGYATRNIDSSISYVLPLSMPLLPALILAIGVFWLPPSPRLLVAQGKVEDAHETLIRLRGEENRTLADIEVLEIQAEASMLERRAYIEGGPGMSVKDNWLASELRGWRLLLSKKYRDRTMVGIVVMFIQQWSGINALLYYGPTLLASFGLGSSNATLLVAGGVGIVQFLAVFPAIAGIDHWGRKFLLRSGSVVMGCSHLIIAMVVYEDSDDWADHRVGAWLAVACLYVFTLAYGVSYGPVGWVLPSEVFPTSIRSKGVALSTMSNWVNNFLIGLLAPVLIEMSPAWTFMIFSIACFFGYLWSTYIIPETASVSLEEIDRFFRSSVGKEDAELRSEIEGELGLVEVIRQIWEEDRPERSGAD